MHYKISVIVLLILSTVFMVSFLIGGDGQPGAIEVTQDITESMINVIHDVNSTIPVN